MFLQKLNASIQAARPDLLKELFDFHTLHQVAELDHRNLPQPYDQLVLHYRNYCESPDLAALIGMARFVLSI